MPTNPYFKQGARSEQILFEDIIIESLKMYGQDVYYLPRDIVNEDRVYGDDIPSRFNSNYKIEMYIENTEGFEGEGDLFTRFGVEIRDEATFIVSKKRWQSLVGRIDQEINSDRPKEGDLVYLPLSKSLFEITHVEHEQPFYQLKQFPTYKMRCTLFEYSGEDLDTGIADIDNIEIDDGYGFNLVLDRSPPLLDLDIGSVVYQELNSSGLRINAEFARWNTSNKTLTVRHVGSSDGTLVQFDTTKPLIINGESYTIQNILETMENAPNNQNEDFTAATLEFLDFTETNPFGDPGD